MALIVVDHPLIQHKLSWIRDHQTGPKEFRELVEEVSMLMAYEVTRSLPTEEVSVQTPLGQAQTRVIAGKHPAIIPILRAGLGMVEGILKLIPNAKVGHIGLYRDHKTWKPVEYYCKLPPDLAEREVIVCDPLLATGGSASLALRFTKDRGAQRPKLVCLIAAPEGIDRVENDHPDVDIYVAAVDRCLDASGYILPGLGDAGDRLFGTK